MSSGKVSALSTPASGPSGATHDRRACTNTATITIQSAALTSSTTANAVMKPAVEPDSIALTGALSAVSAASHNACRTHAATSEAQS